MDNLKYKDTKKWKLKVHTWHHLTNRILQSDSETVLLSVVVLPLY